MYARLGLVIAREKSERRDAQQQFPVLPFCWNKSRAQTRSDHMQVEFKRMLKYLAAQLLLAALPLASPILAQPQGSMPAGMPPTGPLHVHQLAPTVYWVQGGIWQRGFHRQGQGCHRD